MIDINEKWPEILDFLKTEYEIQKVAFQTFILPLKVHSFDDKNITLVFTGGSGIGGLSYVNKRYYDFIVLAISIITGEEYNVNIYLPGNVEKFYANTENDTSENLADIELEQRIKDANLDKRFTFESFVVGNNAVAQATSLAVADSPGEAYNPLFIYGGVGLGKTHLMHAIGNQIKINDSKMKILYISSEKFTNEIINSIQNKNTDAFRKKYRNIDCLIIDDIQFLKNKEMTQEEFFHTFNTLYEANKQIIISSDRLPREIETLEDRLRSRFESGLLADIQSPDLETRIAILRKKAESENISIPHDVISLVASSIDTNIREIEGAYTKIVAYASLMGSPITIDLAKKILDAMGTSTKNKQITFDDIIQVTSDYFKIKKEEFFTKKRTQNIAYPRQIAMYLCREMADFSYPRIGEFFGGRDHTTVIHAYEKIVKKIKEDPHCEKTITYLVDKLKQ